MAPSPSLAPTSWRSFLDAYLQAYFTERSVAGTMDCLDEALTGFGTGIDETARQPGEMKRLYLRDLEQAPGPIRFEMQWVDGTDLGPDHALVFGALAIEVDTQEGPIRFPDLRLSAVLARRGERWRMVHHHLSEPTGRQEEGESFPTRELRLFNERLQAEVQRRTEELEQRNRALETALAEVRTLHGLLPICAGCKRIRDDQGYWKEVEAYFSAHTDATFSHGLCPQCIPSFFPDRQLRRVGGA